VAVRGVDFIMVSVTDMDRGRAFYGETLGLKEATAWPPDFFEFDAGESTIALGKPPAGAPQPPYNNGVSFALAVEDVNAMAEQLRAKGVPILQGPMETSVCHMALIQDPDGNLLWLHQRKDGTAG
jgi:predicted enzyme related to lactoylglutathione lyase